MANLFFSSLLLKAVEQNAKKNKVESSVADDPGMIKDATGKWNGEEIDEFIFDDDE
jgi:hypothetical protein